MSKKSRGSKKRDRQESTPGSDEQAMLKRKDYDEEMERLHGELVTAAGWVETRASRSASSSRGATAPARAGRSRPSPNA